MNTYTATADNGQTWTRTTKNTYTHAALVLEEDGTYSLAGFSGSADLALKAAKTAINWVTSRFANDAKMFRYSDKAHYAHCMTVVAESRIKDAKRTPVVVAVKVGA